MMINWHNSFDEGLKRATADEKLVFLDFFNPE